MRIQVVTWLWERVLHPSGRLQLLWAVSIMATALVPLGATFGTTNALLEGDHLTIVPVTTTTTIVYETHLALRQSIIRVFRAWLDGLATQARDRPELAEYMSVLAGIYRRHQ